MQLLSVGLARSIWLFDINELNPTGRSIFPDVLTWLGEKYSFQSFPTNISDVDQERKGYLFKTGHFQTDNGLITVNFGIFNDGLLAETWASTEKGDTLLEEILQLATARYGLVKPTSIKRQYISELTLRLDHDLSTINPNVSAFCDVISHIFDKHGLGAFQLTGMSFGPDVSSSSYKPPGLVVERKLGASFSENRFWSRAPFTTKDHITALQEFERLLSH